MENQNQTALTPVTVAYGDGIGPEIMEATLRVLQAAGARIAPEVIEIGEKVYLGGNAAGIDNSAWESLARTRVFLKAPITTPFGGGYKSLNVTTRKMLGLFANVRPCVAYSPYVPTRFPNLDIVIIRENEEDLYAGIEYQQTDDVYECLKLVSRSGSEKIIRYAFEYARSRGRKKISCFVKDNIMKMTDGIFHKVFDEVAAEYPDIQTDSYIIDIGTARLADSPERFDVIVTLNLYGDIISDVAAEIAGSVGMAGSANVGLNYAMFEAVHGSAPDIAGKNMANPSGLLNGAIKMLLHIQQSDVAEKIRNAWLKTLEDGIHTGDIYTEANSKQKVGTKEFADAIIERLGQKPAILKAVSYPPNQKGLNIKVTPQPASVKTLIGTDIFLDWKNGTANELGKIVEAIKTPTLSLEVITNRGTKTYPDGNPETYCTDHWRCRYLSQNESTISNSDVIALLNEFDKSGLDVIKTENLYKFNDKKSYSS
ncbi:MAG: NADP-dependent isocitrate dehydrogenase [Bacteroidia bacterium]|nr:NADP-dependent isocitrate dehydrogenase [Bacteroidia bacterium]